MDNLNTGEFTTFDTESLNALKEADAAPIDEVTPKKEEEKNTTNKVAEDIFDVGSEAKFNELGNQEEEKTPAYLEDDEDEEPTSKVNIQRDEDELSDDEIRTQFQTAIDIGTIKVPEDFEFDGSEEAFEVAMTLNQELREREAEDSIYAKIQDPMLKEAIEYGIKGAGFSDFVGYLQSMVDERNFSSYDISTEDKQKEILMHFYQERGLDEDMARRNIDASIIDDKLQDDAEKAQNYYQQSIPQAREQERQEAMRLASERKRAQEAYQKNFNEALRATKFTQQKKNSIRESLQPTVINNSRLPSWQARILEIQNKPEHYIDLLDILNTYDADKGFSSERVEKKVRTSATKTVYDKFRRAGDKKAPGTQRPSGKGPKRPLINPAFTNFTRS
jgi:hypothetical protein